MLEAALKPWAVSEAVAVPYAERRDPDRGRIDQLLAGIYGRVAPRLLPTIGRLGRMAALAEAEEGEIAKLADASLRLEADLLRPQLLRRGFEPALVARAFALVREASRRRLGMRHHKVQLMGGWALLEGRLAEMETGEGKTITALLPAVTVALAGVPVHVITVNDYLAKRDAEALKPVFDLFGLSIGLVQHGQDPRTRRAAYACDVTYCTNKELVFDYLRDRMALRGRREGSRVLVDKVLGLSESPPEMLLRGLQFGIVDEADSVLIDEARTPLIISSERSGADSAAMYETALGLAGQLTRGADFTIAGKERSITVTREGKDRLAQLVSGLPGIWASTRAREELAQQALSALHLFERDRHYIVAEGKVQIVDEYTGRIMADRSWERGLHQMIEAKERCDPTGQRTTLARITYQRFFRRYLRLAGMSGTVAEAAGELWSVYGLRIVRIPTHRKSRRRHLGARLYRTGDEKWRAVAATAERKARGEARPVLVGTRSVAASEQLSVLLAAAGLPHAVLNARQDQAEAEIVAAAGQAGRITVATNIAGRGTDIKIAPEVAKRGGLHVILTDFHDSSRIDRQLFGRTGRQGDPGSVEAIVSLDDELFRSFGYPGLMRVARLCAGGRRTLPRNLERRLRLSAQRAAERVHSKARRETVRMDKQLDKALAFAGESE